MLRTRTHPVSDRTALIIQTRHATWDTAAVCVRRTVACPHVYEHAEVRAWVLAAHRSSVVVKISSATGWYMSVNFLQVLLRAWPRWYADMPETEGSVCLTSYYGRCHKSRRSCARFPPACPYLCWVRRGRGSHWAQGRWWPSGWSPSSELHPKK